MITSPPVSEPLQSGLDRALADPSTAALAAAGAPVFVAIGEPPAVLWASDAALVLFGAADLAGLTARVFAGADPGSKRLLELARALRPGAPSRLERLRFFIGRQSEILTLLCRRTADVEPLFAVAGLDVRPALLRPPVPARRLKEAAPPTADAVEIGEDAPVSMAAPALSEPASPPRLDAEAVKADLQARFDGARSVRFLWQTDASLVFLGITGRLCEVVGCAMSDLVGHSFADVAARFDLDADGTLGTALGRRDTWSGVEVQWPVAGSDAAVPVTLGALPAFDRDRGFEGFRGFGTLHVQRVAARVPAATGPAVTPATDEAAPAIDEAAPATDQATPAADEFAPAAGEPAPMLAEALPPMVETEARDVLAPEASTSPQTADAETQAAGVEAAIEPVEAPVALAVAAILAPEAARPRGQNVVPLRPLQGFGRSPVPGPRLVDPATLSAPEQQKAPSEEQSPALATAAANAPKPSLPERLAGVILTPQAREGAELSNSEQLAFREIARALGARIGEARPAAPPVLAAEAERENAIAAADAPAIEAMPPDRDPIIASGDARAADSFSGPVAPAPAPSGRSATAELPSAMELADMLDRLPVGIVVSRGGETLFANRALAERLGYAEGGALVAADAAKPLSLQGVGETASVTLRLADGARLAVAAKTQAIDWYGAPALLTTVDAQPAPSFSGRVAWLEQEVRQRDNDTRELHAILDTATDGVVVLDEAGSILSLNRAAQALFGYEQNEVAGEPFTLLLGKESHAAAMDYLNGLKGNGVASVLNDGREAIGRARQGGAIPLFITMGRVGAAQNAKFCAVLRDITAWKKAERELNDARYEAERASALKSDFLAKISHEIRTPLNAILGFAEVIMEERFGPVGNDRYKDYLKDIHASGAHVMSLVNDLLDLSKIEAGKLELKFGAVDANKIVSECVSLIQPEANRERVIVRLSVAPNLPNIVADERSLRQIVLNILSNAVKFNVPGGQVIVSTALTDAGHAVIRVRDTGIGMSDGDVVTALEPFRQIATSRNTKGTGLGLPLTKALVEANRASFTIKSKKKEGTLVEVAFPSTRVLAE